MKDLPAERGGDQALLVTADGYEQLRSELERLRTNGRADMSERLREAREDGRLANNPALYELLEEHVRLERWIADLEGQLAAAEIMVPATDGAAGIGSLVRVRDRQTGDVAEHELVGSIEPGVGQRAGVRRRSGRTSPCRPRHRHARGGRGSVWEARARDPRHPRAGVCATPEEGRVTELRCQACRRPHLGVWRQARPPP